MTATAYCLERLSKWEPRERKLKQSLADYRAKSPKRPKWRVNRTEYQLLELTEFGKAAASKINTQKSVVFLYYSSEHSETELKNTINTRKYEINGDKFEKKDVQGVLTEKHRYNREKLNKT